MLSWSLVATVLRLPVVREIHSYTWVVAVILPLLLAGCSTTRRTMPPPTPVALPAPPPAEHAPAPPPPAGKQVGKASWYGPGFHGKETASGEAFNQQELTAAHRTLPLGTKAEVTNLETGKSVKVKINDRGPYVKGRVIDLSKAAAREIGLTKEGGIAPVKIEATPPRKSAKKPAAQARNARRQQGKPTQGEVIAVASDHVQLKTAAGITTVTFKEKTTFKRREESATREDIKQGDHLTVFATQLPSGKWVAHEVLLPPTGSEGESLAPRTPQGEEKAATAGGE